MTGATVGLHWWTFTSSRSVNDVLECLGGSFGSPEPVGGYGHPSSICHESGARVYFGSTREDQPVCVNMPGNVCETWAGEGVTWAEDLAGVVTRSDLACDLQPAKEARRRMVEMRRAWKSGKVQTAIRTFQEHRSDDGWTWYFGGKSANLRLRVYDQRGPLRMEFQLRPEKIAGEQLPEMVARRGVASVWRSLALGIRFPLTWYQELLQGETAQLGETVCEESTLGKVIDQLQLQLGPSLWALQQLGLQLEDLATPPEEIRGDIAAKFLRWSEEAPGVGLDGSKLREEIECRLKSRRS
jgi:hypothetical protein